MVWSMLVATAAADGAIRPYDATKAAPLRTSAGATTPRAAEAGTPRPMSRNEAPLAPVAATRTPQPLGNSEPRPIERAPLPTRRDPTWALH